MIGVVLALTDFSCGVGMEESHSEEMILSDIVCNDNFLNSSSSCCLVYSEDETIRIDQNKIRKPHVFGDILRHRPARCRHLSWNQLNNRFRVNFWA